MQSLRKDSSVSTIRSKFVLAVNFKRCRGCGLCELVCSTIHEDEARPNASRIKVDKDRENYIFKPSVCYQCANPKCLDACPTDAITIDEKTGARIIDENLCDNCGSCATACPFALEGKIIFPHPTRNVYVKCDLCYDRKGDPACAEICPTQAIIIRRFGGT